MQTITPETQKTYQAGIKKFREFMLELCPDIVFPLSDFDWWMYGNFCLERVQGTTTRNYMGHVAWLQQTLGHEYPIWKSNFCFSLFLCLLLKFDPSCLSFCELH